MATNAAAICNIALLRVGNRQTIDSLDGRSTEAQVCKVAYANARDAVLAAASWRFARKRSVLALVSGVEVTGWDFVYALPGDCIAPRFLWAEQEDPPVEMRIPYELEAGDNGTLLLTNQEDAELVYTARVETVARYSPLFVDTLAWVLAADLVLGLPVKPAVAQWMAARAQVALGQAAAANENQVQRGPAPEAEAIRARG